MWDARDHAPALLKEKEKGQEKRRMSAKGDLTNPPTPHATMPLWIGAWKISNVYISEEAYRCMNECDRDDLPVADPTRFPLVLATSSEDFNFL